jgi:hypothetical protein
MNTRRGEKLNTAAISSEEDNSAMVASDLYFKQSPVIIYIMSVKW